MHFNSADVDLSLWSPRWLFASALTSHAKTPLCSHDIASTATVSPRYCSNETERVIGWRHGSRPLTPMVVVIAGGSLQQGRLWTSQSFCCWKTFTAGLKSDRNYGFWPFSLDSARFLLFSFFPFEAIHVADVPAQTAGVCDCVYWTSYIFSNNSWYFFMTD